MAGLAPGRLLPCTGQPPASPPHFCSTDASQPGGGPGHLPPTLPDGAARSPSRVWNWSAASQKPGGQARGQGQPGVGGGRRAGGTRAGRDTHRTWGKTGCGPRSGWLPGPAAQTHSGRSRPRAASGLCAGHKGSWAPRGRGLQGALGAAIRPCSPTAPSRSGPTFGPEGRGREEGGEGPPSPPNSPAGRQIQAPRTYRTASLTAAAPAPGTRRRSRGSPCPRRPRPPARGRPGLWGAGGSAPRQRCARPQQPPPHLGAGSAPGVPCLRTAAALPSRFHPWGHGRLGRMPSMLGHPDPGEAAAEVGSGVLAGTHSFRKVLTVMAEP